jgi:hypothetical protein
MLPLADMVFWGGCLRSESSCIQVNSVYFCHVVTSLRLNQSITGPLQDEIAGIMQLYVKHVVFNFLWDLTLQNYPYNNIVTLSDIKIWLG